MNNDALTDEQIDACWRETITAKDRATPNARRFARAIEKVVRTALAAPVATDEWLKEAERLIKFLGLAAHEDGFLRRPEIVPGRVETSKLLAHLRARPAVPEGFALVPIEPTPGKLMSMAIRHDHSLGLPGYYDQLDGFFGNGVSHQQRLESIIGQMRQLHEEVVGSGFYSVEKESDLAALKEHKHVD